ncbi:MAG: hypothetical protein IPK50_12195 [Fibrobacterota bacterium]|nr:hypothetical protein [Fibrobacterota bacterium]QQS03073.1 MAG: hypothetical protein IPK50_12195 [Fibrobacterota bacterium]
MKAYLAPLALIGALSGCNDSPSESPMESSTPAKTTAVRTISPALQATCKPLPSPAVAARASADDSGKIIVARLRRGDMEAFIYDSMGNQVSHSLQQVSIPDSLESREISILWDGRDQSHKTVPPGHYFQFWTLKDSLGTTLRQDSACVGFVASGS